MEQHISEDSLSPEEPQPRVVTQQNHSIANKDIDKDALKLLTKLHDAGHEAYLVGGGVRDLYLGKTPKDFDISTDARPGQLRKIFRNSRTIGRRFRLVQVFFHGDKIIEVSTFRCRSEHDLNGETTVLPANNTFGNRADDAFRRDLTINSLLYDIQDETIIDYTGGVTDLDNKTIRIVGDPDRRITRDPVRMLRAIRHAARSEFAIEDKTWQAILRHREKIHLCPVSRIRDELLKDLRGGACADWLNLTLQSGIFYEIFPFYEEVLSNNNKERDLLGKLFTVIDRLHQQKIELQEGLLLALLLIPWAQKTFPAISQTLKSSDFFPLFRTMRTEMDTVLNYLNIKRATKEQIASLLSRLHLFSINDKNDKWPAWLIKKSFFKEGSFYYMIYREATGGVPVPSLKMESPPRKNKPKKRPHSGGRRGATMVGKNKKGGIFGLRK